MTSENDSSNELEKQVRGLRQECEMKRVPISESGKDLLQYVQDNKVNDPFLNRELMAAYPGGGSDSGVCCRIL